MRRTRARRLLIIGLLLLVVAAVATANPWPAVVVAVILLALLAPSSNVVPHQWRGGNMRRIDERELEQVAARHPGLGSSSEVTDEAWKRERERRGLSGR